MTTEIRITIDARDKAHADRVIDALVSKVTERSRLMKVLGEALLDATRERFQAEEAPDGAKWKKLAPLTLALRRGSSILRSSGRLYGSLHYTVAGNVLTLAPAPLPYAKIHQTGGVIVPRKGKALAIPFKAGFRGAGGKKANRPGVIFLAKVTIEARPYIGFGAREERAAREGIASWLGEI